MNQIQEKKSRLSGPIFVGLHDAIAAEGANLSFGFHAVPEFHFYFYAIALGSI